MPPNLWNELTGPGGDYGDPTYGWNANTTYNATGQKIPTIQEWAQQNFPDVWAAAISGDPNANANLVWLKSNYDNTLAAAGVGGQDPNSAQLSPFDQNQFRMADASGGNNYQASYIGSAALGGAALGAGAAGGTAGTVGAGGTEAAGGGTAAGAGGEVGFGGDTLPAAGGSSGGVAGGMAGDTSGITAPGGAATAGGGVGSGTSLPPGLSSLLPILSRLGGGGGGGAPAAGVGAGAGGGMDLGFLTQLLGGGAGLAGLLGPNQSNPGLNQEQQNLTNAGNTVFNTALDPQQALYNRTLQQTQDQARAGSSAHGVAMGPYAAGVENQATNNFNIDWQNNQLARQAQGLGAMSQANNASTGIGQLGLQNRQFGANQNAASLNALLTALTGGSRPGGTGSTSGIGAGGGLGSLFGSLFPGLGGGASGGSVPGLGGGVDQFGQPIGGGSGLPAAPPPGNGGGGDTSGLFDNFSGNFGADSFSWNTPMPGAGGGNSYTGGFAGGSPGYSWNVPPSGSSPGMMYAS